MNLKIKLIYDDCVLRGQILHMREDWRGSLRFIASNGFGIFSDGGSAEFCNKVLYIRGKYASENDLRILKRIFPEKSECESYLKKLKFALRELAEKYE